MIRIPGKIPVRITGGFWLVAALIGFLNSRSLFGTLIWVVIIFVSVLVHEFGHALLAKAFGQRPRIELVPFGGVTYPEGPKLKLWKEFLVVFNGPFFGFMLFVLSSLFLTSINPKTSPMFFQIVNTFRVVNLFWAAINLFPSMPLDGGQLLRIILEAIFKHKALRYTLFVSMIFSAVVSLLFFLWGGFLIGAIFFLFAFQNFETWRRTKSFSPSDQSDQNKELLKQGEIAFLHGKKNEARDIFVKLRNESKTGILFSAATQRLAQIEGGEGHFKSVYEMLKPIEDDVSEEIYPLFQRSAYEAGDFNLVERLGIVSYRNTPTAEVAIRNADACAALGKAKAAIGWLKASLREEAVDISPIIEKVLYDSVREDPEFKKFINNLRN